MDPEQVRVIVQLANAIRNVLCHEDTGELVLRTTVAAIFDDPLPGALHEGVKIALDRIFSEEASDQGDRGGA